MTWDYYRKDRPLKNNITPSIVNIYHHKTLTHLQVKLKDYTERLEGIYPPTFQINISKSENTDIKQKLQYQDI